MWRYLLFRLAAWVIPHIGATPGYWLFARLADVLFLLAWRTRGLGQRNIAQALGPAARPRRVRRLTRHAFWNLLWNYYELFHLPALTLDTLRARVHVEGAEHWEALAARGSGAILVFPHIGNLEVLMQLPLLYPQRPCLVLVERMRDDRLFRFMNGLRGSHGLQLVAASEALRIVRALRQGRTLLLAGDFDSTQSGIIVNFLGAPARMPDGAVRLALRTGAPLLIGYGWREMTPPPAAAPARGAARPRFKVTVTPPVPLTRTADGQADARRGVEEVIGRLEPLIRAHLDQWLAFHPYWQETLP